MFIIERNVLKSYTGGESILQVPDGVIEIGYRAFYSNTTIKQIVLPESVVKIGIQAFAGCTALEQMIVPDGLQQVGWEAFADTAWLAAQPEGVVYAGKLALMLKGNRKELYTKELQQVQVQDGTTKLCADLFRNCTALEQVELPDSLECIDDRAFQNCRKLKHIAIPHHVSRIGDRAFDECIGLQLDLAGSNVAFGRQCFMNDTNVHLTGMSPEQLPHNVRNSAIIAFADDVCNHLELDAVMERQTMQYIQTHRKRLYDLAITHWNLLQVMIDGQMIPLDDVDGLLDIILASEQADHAAALLKYKQEQQNNQSLTLELEDAFSFDAWDDLTLDWDVPVLAKTTEQLQKEWGTKRLPDDTFTAMSYHGDDADMVVPSRIGDQMITAISPWACSPGRHGLKRETVQQRSNIATVTIEEGIARIGNQAFAHCKNLRSITLPESIVDIGYEAFIGCENLTEITIPHSVKTIGRAAFAGCTKLQTVQLPESINIAADAFDETVNLI